MRHWLAVLSGAVVLVAFDLPGVTVGGAVAALLVAAALALAVRRSTGSGPGLVVALAGLHFVVSALVTVPEAVLFDVMEPSAAPPGLVKALVASLATAAVVVAVAGRLGGEAVRPQPAPIRSLGDLLWRLAATPAVFVVFYFVAGMIIFPFVEGYYEGRVLPDPLAIVSMQVLRALAMAGAAYPLLRILETRRDAVLVLAVTLPVWGAVAPLLPANELMPGSVRLVHALETVPYYALFGALVAVWFGPTRRRTGEPIPATRAAAV